LEPERLEAREQGFRFGGERFEALVLHAVFAFELADQKLRIGADFDPTHAGFERSRQPQEQRLVLGDVVRRLPEVLALGRKHASICRFQDCTAPRGTRVAARRTVRPEDRLLRSRRHRTRPGSHSLRTVRFRHRARL